ncbi:MAG TPA: cytochrome P450 [Candidatus Binatia bacterium]|nr:cytochrome P450 [Candidatus Binatia bacterium]
MDDVSAAFDPQLMFEFPDPYPMFAEMRRTNPVACIRFMNRESFVVTRYDDVWTVLRDGDTFSSRANAEVSKFMGRTILEMDGREHGRHRALISAIFTARAIDALEAVIERLVHERIDGFAGDTRADLVTQLTTIFPVEVIAHIVGVPHTDYATFMRWSLDLIAFSRNPQKGREASSRLHEYLLPIVRDRRAAPHDDVISRLVTGTVDGVGLTDDEVISFLRLLLPAGAETTSRLMGSMLFALLTEPDRIARVRADRTLVQWAIEETLRWETPVLFVARQATRATTIAGIDVPAGTMVSAVVASANRDESHYAEPDRFDLDRHADDHLSFGFGRHFCLGYHLAKMEARTALTAVADRFPDLRLDPEAPAPRITGLAFRSPQSLPVLLRG